MDTLLIILVVGAVIGLWFWTFRMKDETAGRFLKVFYAAWAIMAVVALVGMCMTGPPAGIEDRGDRYYRR